MFSGSGERPPKLSRPPGRGLKPGDDVAKPVAALEAGGERAAYQAAGETPPLGSGERTYGGGKGRARLGLVRVALADAGAGRRPPARVGVGDAGHPEQAPVVLHFV